MSEPALTVWLRSAVALLLTALVLEHLVSTTPASGATGEHAAPVVGERNGGPPSGE